MRIQFLCALLILTPLSHSFSEDLIQPSIVGGNPSNSGEYPWIVALVEDGSFDYSEAQFCGGALIHPYWVLTAAHCVNDYDASSFNLLIGTNNLNSGGMLLEPAAIYLHPEVDLRRIDRGSDLALIRLHEPVTDVTPVPLLRAASLFTPGRSVKAVGWGSTEYYNSEDTTSDILREVNLTLADIEAEITEGDPVLDFFVMSNDEEITSGTGTGDSGGPLLLQLPDTLEWALAGVTSFGVNAPTIEYNVSFFASVPFSIDWIDSHLYPEFSSTEELPLTERIQRRIKQGSELGVGYVFWPFQDGVLENLLPQRFPDWEDTITFQLGSDRFLYNGDGSFSYLEFPSDVESSESPFTSLVDIVQTSELSYGNAPLPAPPFSRFLGEFDAEGMSFNKFGQIYELVDLQAGFEYRLQGDSEAAKQSLFEVDGSNLTELYSADSYSSMDYSFTYDPEKTYWLNITPDSQRFYRYSFALAPTIDASFDDDTSYSGVLSSQSHPFKTSGTRVEQVHYTGNRQNEVELVVYSEFDCEIAVIRESDNALTGYNDIEAEFATERYIVSSDDLREGRVSIFNFDKESYGAFTVSVEPHTQSNVIYGETSERAITRHDTSFYDNGDLIYYESHTARDRSNISYLKVEINALYFSPLVAVFDGNDVVDFSSGTQFIELEWESEPNTSYDIEVYDFEGPQNGNYDITITGSTTATLTESSSDPEPTPMRGKPQRHIVHGGKQLTDLEIEQRLQRIALRRAMERSQQL